MDVERANDGTARLHTAIHGTSGVSGVHVHDVEVLSEHPTDRRRAAPIDAEARPGPTERHRHAASERLLVIVQHRRGRSMPATSCPGAAAREPALESGC